MRESPTSPTVAEHRRESETGPVLAGIHVREDDIETVKGIRAVAYLFRGMAILMLLLTAVQIISGMTGTVPLSVGVVFAEAVRLIIFAGLLWGAGDLAVLLIKSHYDIRATRILTARVAYMLRTMGEATGSLPPASAGTRADRET